MIFGGVKLLKFKQLKIRSSPLMGFSKFHSSKSLTHPQIMHKTPNKIYYKKFTYLIYD